MTLPARMRAWRSRLDDLLRYNPAPQACLCLLHWALAAIKPKISADWLSHACSAARCAPSSDWMQAVEQWTLRRLDQIPNEVLWSWQPPESDTVEVRKSAILKPSRPGEKGVVFVSFESQWEKLLALGPRRLAAFSEAYELVVAPTWSPPHSPANLVFPRLFPGPLPCTISNLQDLEIFPRLHPSYRPARLFASSWVNAELYEPRAHSDRDIDLLMIANFGRYKRHHVLFRALGRIPRDQRPNVVLVGQPHGNRTADVLLREMDDYGVRDSITLRSRISDAEVLEILCRSKVAVITSLREGSCVAVVESMMADTPLGLLREAHIGSSAFLNEHTGRWLDPDRLDQELLRFIADARTFSPRTWLLDHGVHCTNSTRVLNSHLKALAESEGRPWTEDCAEHHWRPDPLLRQPDDQKMAFAEAKRIQEQLGLILPIAPPA